MPNTLRCAAFLVTALTATAAMAQDKFFNSNGVRIRYVDQGTGEPVVLIHGMTSTIENAWVATGVIENLAKDHRVIALDLRGHGKSDTLGTFNLSRVGTKWAHSPESSSEDLADLRELLGTVGGRQEARTPDLRVANAALSQLS
jgi:alpha-beta hydrolase superfamily lysophospholipase